MQIPQNVREPQDTGHISAREAARLLNVSPDTIRRQATALGLGRKVLGRWRLNRAAVTNLLTGDVTR